MIVSVASGKGGTGKTTVTASLAVTWPNPLMAVDLDVEEPNLHLFLKPEATGSEVVTLEVPDVDESKCTFCRKCAELCQFKAIAVMGKAIMTFPEMCHGCGGCMAICPEGAIGVATRELGVMEFGVSRGRIPCTTGRLRVGEAMSPPLMRVVRSHMRAEARAKGLDVLVDAPPGVSCPAMSAVADSDVIVLVTEPTPFGFHDFKLACEAFAPYGKPMAVVINRAGLGDDRVYGFCAARNLPIVAEIPYRRDIAEHYSKGLVLAEMDQGLGQLFSGLAAKLMAMGKEADHA
ncbi:4Fe-4S binding protein [Desulfomicrobium escambiense]|uniref:4Fe-4S binding protein n=1 Tax=Desulfomicrobium escambiense TaxID=29503 RepID=UPI0004032596|nr:ATP-binding protein [Desulfomicrobium escambiense]